MITLTPEISREPARIGERSKEAGRKSPTGSQQETAGRQRQKANQTAKGTELQYIIDIYN